MASRIVLATSFAAALVLFLLLVLDSGPIETRASTSEGLQQDYARSPQRIAANGIYTRPIIVGVNRDPRLDLQDDYDPVLGQLMEGPLRHRPDGTVEPAAAVTYTVSGDGSVYTVTLRPDARWSDGQMVTAAHYVDGILRLLDPSLDSSYYGTFLYVLENGEAYRTGVITDPSQVGVTALDTHTLRFTLEYPAGHFPTLMATPSFYPARLDLITSDPNWTEAGHFVGNGPYMLTEWVHNDHVVVERNPYYHSADQVTMEEIRFEILDDWEQLRAYENDRLDVSAIPADELPRVLADPVLSREFHRTPYAGVYFLEVNVQLTPTNILAVRKALASAIDRSHILTNVLAMPWREPATSVIPPEIPGYQNGAVGYTFNVTQAQAYLADAGYPGGAGFPVIEVWANEGNESIINAVADQWRSNLGITVTTVYTGFGAYLGRLGDCRDDPGACTYNACRLGWIMDYGDANNILYDLFYPNARYQYTGWDNERYRQLISMTMTETNQISRTAYFQEADRILVEDDVAVIPLFFYDRQTLIKSDLLYEYTPFWYGPYFMHWRVVTVVTDTITDSGGTVSSPDGDIEVTFPDGAVTGTALVTYTSFYLPPYPPPGTLAFAGNGFVLDVTDLTSGQPITTFAKPLTVTIKYTDGDLNGQDEETLEFLYWNGSAWVDDGITIVERDTLNNRLVVQIEHLTEFALFGRYRLFLPLILRGYR
jgi:oligopeptide transport system substrate-binding protein